MRAQLQHLPGKYRNLNCFSTSVILAVAPRQEGEEVPEASGHASLPPPAYVSWVSFKVFSVKFTEWGEITLFVSAIASTSGWRGATLAPLEGLFN